MEIKQKLLDINLYMNDRLMDQVNYILNTHWYQESLQKNKAVNL